METNKEEQMLRTLWNTLVQLKRVCVMIRLPAHARACGKLLDQLEDIMNDEVEHGEDDEKGFTTIRSEEEADGLDERPVLRR